MSSYGSTIVVNDEALIRDPMALVGIAVTRLIENFAQTASVLAQERGIQLDPSTLSVQSRRHSKALEIGWHAYDEDYVTALVNEKKGLSDQPDMAAMIEDIVVAELRGTPLWPRTD